MLLLVGSKACQPSTGHQTETHAWEASAPVRFASLRKYPLTKRAVTSLFAHLLPGRRKLQSRRTGRRQVHCAARGDGELPMWLADGERRHRVAEVIGPGSRKVRGRVGAEMVVEDRLPRARPGP